MTVVLDSWALLRYLEDTAPAAKAVERLLERERPIVSWISLGEVFYVVRRAHGEAPATATVRDLRDVTECEVPDERLVIDAGRIKAEHPLAYADAFAAATSMRHGATLWTGDPELLVRGAAWDWLDLRTAHRR